MQLNIYHPSIDSIRNNIKKFNCDTYNPYKILDFANNLDVDNPYFYKNKINEIYLSNDEIRHIKNMCNEFILKHIITYGKLTSLNRLTRNNSGISEFEYKFMDKIGDYIFSNTSKLIENDFIIFKDTIDKQFSSEYKQHTISVVAEKFNVITNSTIYYVQLIININNFDIILSYQYCISNMECTHFQDVDLATNIKNISIQ